MDLSGWLGVGASVMTILIGLPVVIRMLLKPIILSVMNDAEQSIQRRLNKHLDQVAKKVGEQINDHVRSYHYGDRS